MVAPTVVEYRYYVKLPFSVTIPVVTNVLSRERDLVNHDPLDVTKKLPFEAAVFIFRYF